MTRLDITLLKEELKQQKAMFKFMSHPCYNKIKLYLIELFYNKKPFYSHKSNGFTRNDNKLLYNLKRKFPIIRRTRIENISLYYTEDTRIEAWELAVKNGLFRKCKKGYKMRFGKAILGKHLIIKNSIKGYMKNGIFYY